MPFATPIRTVHATDLAPRLPPPFTLVRLRERGDAFGHARHIAAEAGAGTLVHVGRFDAAEFALVLEPEEPLSRARRAFHAGMAALADALAAHAPPETLIDIKWPGALTVNLGLVGGGRLAWPYGAAETDVPDWLVFGAMVRTASPDSEPGADPDVTALTEEGFGETGAIDVVESFARNMMLYLDAWQDGSFSAVADSYLRRLARGGDSASIADNGDLLLRHAGNGTTDRRALMSALATDDAGLFDRHPERRP